MSSLTFITFFFKLNNNTYYGKYYTDNLSPDHEGLDEEIKPYLLQGISEYLKEEQLPYLNEEVRIGILSVATNQSSSIHSSDQEIKCFAFYCQKCTINYKISLKMYMFGKLIKNPGL